VNVPHASGHCGLLRALLNAIAPQYGLKSVTRSYAAGISNGGYQTRRAIETDFRHQRLYDGGVDWEGTLFLPALPPGIQTRRRLTGYNLFTYLPTALLNLSGDVSACRHRVAALAAVGFNPQSQPLWAYHWSIYWGLTQKIYRLEFESPSTRAIPARSLGIGSGLRLAAGAHGAADRIPTRSTNYRTRHRAEPPPSWLACRRLAKHRGTSSGR